MTPRKSDLSAVLLAGGQSRRMGRDKALLEIEGRPLWQIQIAKLEAVASEVLVSVRDAGSAISTSHRKVSDPPEAQGPLAGLAAALEAARYSHLLVLAVDLPAMTPAYLFQLGSLVSEKRGIVPQLDGYFQGTAAIYPREILPLVRQALGSNDLSLQALIRAGCAAGLLSSVPVQEPERPLFANWNSAADVKILPKG